MGIELFNVNGNHFDVGAAVGRKASEAINQFFDQYDLLNQQLLPFFNSSAGKRYYDSFLELHRAHFPEYMLELEGMAHGAHRPFEQLFLVNLRGELAGLIGEDERAEQCSDCLIVTEDEALIGHNEDGSTAAAGKMFFAQVALDGGVTFGALCYPGCLPGNAFGFNQSGIVHTVNNLSPRPVKVGLGRHFLARALLDSGNLDDAISSVSMSGRASGFNYNIGSLKERRVVSVEVAPDRMNVHQVSGHYFHANHYVELHEQEQEISRSSIHRQERSRTLCRSNPPRDVHAIMKLLGDQSDPDYPIYRDGRLPDENTTLCSAIYDLDGRKLRIYLENPAQVGAQSLELPL